MNQTITFAMNENVVSGIADHIEKEYIKNGKGLDRLAFVFGGKRPSLFLKRELFNRSLKSVFSPRFFSMDEFIRYLVSKAYDFSIINEMESSFELYGFSKSLAPEFVKGYPSFGRFYPWGKEIHSFLDQIDMEDVADEKLKGVGKSAQIGYDLPKEVNDILKSLADIHTAYHDFMEKKKRFSKGFMYLKAARNIKETGLDEFDKIFFCNMFYFHKTEKNILKYLYDSKKADFFFQGEKNDWPSLLKLSDCFGIGPALPKVKAEPEIHIYSSQDTHSQCALAREILDKVREKEKAVLVIPDSDSVMPALSELSGAIKDFNISLGYPLSRTGVFSLLSDIKTAQESRNEHKYYSKDYIRVLKNPLVKNLKIGDDPSLTRILVHKIEEALTGENTKAVIGGSLFVSTEDVLNDKSILNEAAASLAAMKLSVFPDRLEKIFIELHDFVFKNWEPIENFSDFIRALKKLLEKLISGGYFTAYQLNIKAVDRLLKIADEFEQCSFIKETFKKDEIFKIFEARLSSEMVSFAGSPLQGFQILGPLEVRALNFETVVIIDMNESKLPNLNVQESLIPRDVMIELGLERLEKEEEIQRYHFKSLLAGAKTAHLIYCDSDKFERSRFLEQIIWEKQKNENSLIEPPIFEPRFNFKVEGEKRPKTKTSDIIKYLEKFVYSPTSLNTYINCPMKFYFQYVLGLKEKEDVAEDVERVDVGIFIHGFLENTLKAFVGKKYEITADFETLFLKRFEIEFENEFEKKMRADAFLLKEVIRESLKRFLRNERIRCSEIAEILGLEENIKGLYNNRAFNIKIDRIDLLKDGSMMILDYKTGGIILPQRTVKLETIADNLSRKKIKQYLRSLQLPIYMHFVADYKKADIVNVNAGLYDLKQGNIEFFYKKEDNLEKKMKFEVSLKAMDFILDEIHNKDIPFVADDSETRQCSNCPFYYACR